MRDASDAPHPSLAGSLLLAHPAMPDGHFRRTVVLLTAHNGDGALGVVLNRPLGQRLGLWGAGDFALGPLADVPLFQGGPVQTEQLIFAAWRPNLQGFRLHFGVDTEKAVQLLAEDGIQLRAFLGYSGWSAGQLENELQQNTWVVAAAPSDLFTRPPDQSLWRAVLGREGAEWRLLAEEPDDPEQN